MAGQYVQRSLDDLGTPLADVTFCVLDIETTGSDRLADGITELGAVKVRGGIQQGTFHTMVNPGTRIPPSITVLTGITESMVASAPRIEQVLPAFDEFARGCVLVGHNVRFDISFLDAARHRRGDAPLDHTVVDTLPLARRLVRDEVPDCRLGTLANRFRLTTRPTHRAFDDAMATPELLHVLLERAAAWGVLGLDDLIALPRLGSHPQVAKLRMTNNLPRSPGVYTFRDARGEVLYVGKATNLRSRVRSYFGSEDRRKVGPMLREAASVQHVVTPDVLVAEVLEARLLRTLRPRYNAAGTGWDRYCYVRLTTNEPWPRLTITRSPGGPGWFIGPLPSRAPASLVIDALHSVFPLRRCTARLGARFRPAAGTPTCTAHQLGRAHCPCSGNADPREYAALVATVQRVVTDDPQFVVDQLAARMSELAGQRRFEEAALVRDRAQAFAQAVVRQRRVDRLRRAGEVRLDLGTTQVRIVGGVLQSYATDGQLELPLDVGPPVVGDGSAVEREAVDEMLVLARAVERRRPPTLMWCDGVWASRFPAVRVPQRLAA